MKHVYPAFAQGVACLVLCCFTCAAHGTVYYVSESGADGNAGDTEEAPWRTIRRVNRASLVPGDIVLFRRGDVWREQLRPHSGDASAVITYGAYGEGPKPVLLGSVALNSADDWVAAGSRLWSSLPPTAAGKTLLPNSDFSEEDAPWHLHYEGGAQAACGRDTEVFHSAPAAYRVLCKTPGKSGSHIQFYTRKFSVEEGAHYRLTFRVKSTAPVSFNLPTLMKAGPPYSRYAARSTPTVPDAGPEWQQCTHYYTSTVSAEDARLTFFLGTALSADTTLYLDDVYLHRCEPGAGLMSDVGNIIFNDEALCGVKVWNREDLADQGQFWYDEKQRTVTIYSAKNPALYYTDIECALREHIINQTNAAYITYENLALRYGGAHGFGGGTTHHITIRDCDLSYIGGGDQRGGDHTVRFGNGIEFWGAAHDHLVERCRLWEIYDAALTNQSSGPSTPQYNITYRHNVIWNSEYSFEYWNRPEESTTHNIFFENNTCVNAGHGWGHTQRADPSGRHLCFYNSPATLNTFYVRNNIFYEAKKNAFYAPAWTPDQLHALTLDHNLWYQAEGMMIAVASDTYPMASFAEYQQTWNTEAHSRIGNPLFINAAHLDFRPAPGSPCIDAGMDLGYTTDHDGKTIPRGDAPDIGAFERTDG